MCQAPFSLLVVHNNLHLSLSPVESRHHQPHFPGWTAAQRRKWICLNLPSQPVEQLNVQAEWWPHSCHHFTPPHTVTYSLVLHGQVASMFPGLSPTPSEPGFRYPQSEGCLRLELVLWRAEVSASSGRICVTLTTGFFVRSECACHHDCPTCLRCFF